MFKGDYFEMKGGFLLLNSHLLTIYNHVPIPFDTELSMHLKHMWGDPKILGIVKKNVFKVFVQV